MIKFEGVEADLILFVTAANDPNEGYAAWAASCLFDSASGSNRPIAG